MASTCKSSATADGGIESLHTLLLQLLPHRGGPGGLGVHRGSPALVILDNCLLLGALHGRGLLLLQSSGVVKADGMADGGCHALQDGGRGGVWGCWALDGLLGRCCCAWWAGVERWLVGGGHGGMVSSTKQAAVVKLAVTCSVPLDDNSSLVMMIEMAHLRLLLP